MFPSLRFTQVQNKKDKRSMIGVLDIYGFEIFPANGFEQVGAGLAGV